MKKIIKKAFFNSLPVFAGYLFLGFGFGIIAEGAGYGIIWAFFMSLFIYAGSMQYVSVSLLTSGASLISVAITTLMVNARHLFYGITMIEPYKKAGKLKPYLMFSLTDETYSLVCEGKAPEGCDFHKYSFFLSMFNQSYWILGSTLGALVGTLFSFNTKGVEFAMTALFVTVFVEQWKSTKDHVPAIIGAASALVCLFIFGSESFLIPTMIVISIALLLMKRIRKEKAETPASDNVGNVAEGEEKE